MYGIVDGLEFSDRYVLYQRQAEKNFRVKNLRTNTDVIAMVQDMTKNRHIHVYLEEEVTETDTTTKEVTKEYIEETEKHDDSGSEEDPNYVAEDDNSESENFCSGFEDSENDDSDQEMYAHDVPGIIGFEMSLNNDLGGFHVRLNDDDDMTEVGELQCIRV
ncbi:hypothetical protein V6N13_113870 [Hibiscus sabdariffa]